MRTLVVLLAVTSSLVGCQMAGVVDRSEPEQKGYLYDSGSRKAAETAGEPLNLNPGQASSTIIVSSNMIGTEPGVSNIDSNPGPVKQEPRWEPLIDGAQMAIDTSYDGYPRVLRLSNGAQMFSSQWDGYLKDLVQSIRPEARQGFLDGISRHSTDFDEVERSIVFGPMMTSPSPYRERSHIGVAGVISNPTTSSAFLKLYYRGSRWIFADRVVIRLDDEVIRFDDVEFDRDNAGGNVWETAYLNLSVPAYRQAAEKIVTSDVAIVRMTGDKTYDLRVSDRMKTDIQAMLVGIDALRER